MKKIIFLIILSVNSIVYAETETKIAHNERSKFYQEHKKQLMEQAKSSQEMRKQKGITTDAVDKSNTDGEVVDFSTGKPVKKQ